MSRQAVDLDRRDLATLAGALDTTAETLAAELERRPWFVNDLLRDPAVVALALEDADGRISRLSPNLYFTIVAFHAADELADAPWVADWVGPKNRLPVFDVEPLLEFTDNPRRTAFIAALLAGFAVPEQLPVPGDARDFADIIGWLDAVDPDVRVLLLRRLGDLALFLAGVFPDATGSAIVEIADLDAIGRSIGLAADEVISLLDVDPAAPGLNALEALGAAWYTAAAAADERATPRLVVDVAARIRPARRFLNHLTDRYLTPDDIAWAI